MPLTADTSTSSRTSVFAMSLAGVLLLGLAAGGFWSANQVAMVPSAVPAYMAVEGDGHRESLSSNTHAPQLRISSSGPIWREISESQRQILMPLRERWDSMGALAKRRWLVLADRYPKMDESERNKLLSRMNTWASLSAQQRNQARLNFESTKRLSAQELQAKWDEYQALSEAEKKRLAEQARKAKAAKKAKRRLAVPAPKVEAPKKVIAAPAAPAPAVQTQAIPTPQAAPSTHLPPLDHAQPIKEGTTAPVMSTPTVATQPVAVPQSMPSVELPPLPALESAGTLDKRQALQPAAPASTTAQ